MLVAPTERERDHHKGVEQRLYHALRSAQLAGISLPTFWRLRDGQVSVARMLVVNDAAPQHVVQLARRHYQGATVAIQRVPYEHIVVYHVVAETRVEVPVP